MRSPVLYLIFNRPDIVRRTFEALRAARPPRLYIAADGPRADRPGEAELCEQTRRIALAVDWPCQVRTLFREKNLGLQRSVESALSWFFEQEPEGIILEDDILPHPDFFTFCDTLLERYRDDERIFSVNGGNFQMGRPRGDASYYFSIFSYSWGWASWARAWARHDPAMPGYRAFMQDVFPAQAGSRKISRYFLEGCEGVAAGRVHTWDIQWTYTVFSNNGLCAVPNRILALNLGFDQGIHFTDPPIWKYLTLEAMPEIIHPDSVHACAEADLFTFTTAYTGLDFFSLIEEGNKRIDAGQASSNHEMIRLLRTFFADNSELSKLEILTLLAEGRLPEAVQALSRAQKNYPNAAESFALIAAGIKRLLRN